MTAPGPATLSSTPDEARRSLQADVKRLRARVSRLRRQTEGVGPRLKLAETLRDLGQRLYLLADWDAARERFEDSDAVELGHDEIEGDDVGAQLFDLLQRVEAIAREPDDLEARILAEDLAQDLACERRVIDDEEAMSSHAFT